MYVTDVQDYVKDALIPFAFATGEDDLVLDVETLEERFVHADDNVSGCIQILLNKADEKKVSYIHVC